LPKWVSASRTAGHIGNIGKAGVGTIDDGFRCESLEDAHQFIDGALATRMLLKSGPKLLSGKRTTLAKGAGGALVVNVALTGAELIEGQINQSQAIESVLVSAAAGVGGMAVGAGVVWGIGTWGVASTGTAISSLSGAAYTSAVMAKLGGGTLAAGGLGAAGGAVALTGGVAIVAVGVGYGAKKLYDIANPAERDGYMMYYKGVSGHDLVDSETETGYAILSERKAIDDLRRRIERQRR